jgi:hypothetical protein
MLTPCPDPDLAIFYEGLPVLRYVYCFFCFLSCFDCNFSFFFLVSIHPCLTVECAISSHFLGVRNRPGHLLRQCVKVWRLKLSSESSHVCSYLVFSDTGSLQGLFSEHCVSRNGDRT